MADGWTRHAPGDDLVLRPMSDGGPGFVEVVAEATGAELLKVAAAGPLGDDVTATIAMVDGTAYIEAAQVCGLALVPGKVRNPGHTSTFGVGQLVLAAIEAGATRIVVGLGGSATNDGGAGLLCALGAEADGPLDAGGGPLRHLSRVDVTPARAATAGVELVAASDVDNPLLGMRGATRTFAPRRVPVPNRWRRWSPRWSTSPNSSGAHPTARIPPWQREPAPPVVWGTRSRSWEPAGHPASARLPRSSDSRHWLQTQIW